MADLPTVDTGPEWPRRTHLALHEELHARPALAVPATPAVVSYWAQWGMTASAAHTALEQVCTLAGAAAPAPGARHHRVRASTFDLKYERHGEFVSWQVNRTLPQPGDMAEDAWLQAQLRGAGARDALPPGFAASLTAPGAGEMLAAAHVVILPCHDEQLLGRTQALMSSRLGVPREPDDSATLVGGWIADGRAAVLSDLQLAEDGFTRLVLLDFGLRPDQRAREAQRLCEIEAYRMLAMLGFPLAQQEGPALSAIERRLQHTVDRMTQHETTDDAQAFDALTRLAAEVEHIAARTRYRFSATRAYHQIVQRRLADLRETRLGGLQTLSSFLARRFAPAIASCESTDARVTDLADRIARAVALAQVRIEVHREASNQRLLGALAHRQKLQLRLQQTVEGLSVVAISYYVLGLVGYLAKAWKTVSPWPVAPDGVVGIAALPVVLGLSLFTRRLRRHLATSGPQENPDRDMPRSRPKGGESGAA